MHYYLDQFGELWVSTKRLSARELEEHATDEGMKLTRVPCRAARSHMQHAIAGWHPSHYTAANVLAYAYVKQTGNLI